MLRSRHETRAKRSSNTARHLCKSLSYPGNARSHRVAGGIGAALGHGCPHRNLALTLTETKAAPAGGSIGLFVDIGCESFFSNLKVTPN
jgi:hypothetical protein